MALGLEGGRSFRKSPTKSWDLKIGRGAQEGQ